MSLQFRASSIVRIPAIEHHLNDLRTCLDDLQAILSNANDSTVTIDDLKTMRTML